MTTRQKKLLELLWGVRGYITAKDIAQHFDLSEKTIRNEINALSGIIFENKSGRIIGKTNKGFFLEIDRSSYQKITSSYIEVSSYVKVKNRINRMMLILLCYRRCDVEDLADELHIDKKSIKKYLYDVTEKLSKFDIAVHRKDTEISLLGKEKKFRMAWWGLFQEIKEKLLSEDLYDEINNGVPALHISANDRTALKMLFGESYESCHLFSEMIVGIEKKFGIKYTYDAFLWLVFNLMLINDNKKSLGAVVFSKPVLSLLHNASEYQFVETLSESMQQAGMKALSGYDIDYFSACFLTGETDEITEDKLENTLDNLPFEFNEALQDFLSSLCSLIGDKFKNDKDFLQKARLLLRPVLFQSWLGLKRSVSERGESLVRQVKQNYLDLYLEVEYLSTFYKEKHQIILNEYDISILTLCVKNAQSFAVDKVKVVVVCHYGIGVSQYVAEKIKRSVSQVEVVEIVSVRDLHSVNKKACDIIISTVPVNNTDIPVLEVSGVLLPYDIDLIRTTAKEMQKNRLLNIPQVKKLKVSAFIKYYDADIYCAENEMSNKVELLTTLCNQAYRSGYVESDYIDTVLMRDKMSSTEIARGIILIHGDPLWVKQNLISVTVLPSPMVWEESVSVDVIILVAFKKNEDNRIDSDISGFYANLARLVEDEQSISELRNAKSRSQLNEMLLNHL